MRLSQQDLAEKKTAEYDGCHIAPELISRTLMSGFLWCPRASLPTTPIFTRCKIMKPTRVLIAYDGSDGSKQMLDDLPHTGLGESVEATVLCFAEVWLPEPEHAVARQQARVDEKGKMVESRSVEVFRQALVIAAEGGDRVQEMFPAWKVNNETHADSPAWGMMEKVWDWNPDLVIVGSDGRSALGRLIHGSVGQKLLAEAHCSVRIARAPYGRQIGGLRLILAVDGSDESDAAVRSVASRRWPAGSVVRVISVYDQRAMDTALGTVTARASVVHEDADIEVVEQRAENALQLLVQSGIGVQSIVTQGNPAAEILEEAERWGGDAIFMGAHGHGFIERALIGSVSNAVATRAHCSVEVVRLPR